MFLAFFAILSFADEGMWLPEQLPEIGPAWAERGLEIDPETLADPLQAPLGAIVSLGFCSASFVSPDGLIATNHHCVEGFLQYNSSAEANRHRDGYLATSRDEELPVGPAGRLWVVEKIEDVTDAMLARVRPRMKDSRRNARLEEAEKRLIADCEMQENRRCRVTAYDGGGTFRLITSVEIKDVRLVYAPPMSVGQFGGEIDNWMWPRQSGDFALLRAYVSPEGRAVPHAENNEPFRPPHWLRVNPEGASPESFVMIAGYPGRTRRHARARSLRWMAEDYLPLQRDVLQEIIAILDGHAGGDPEAAARLGAPISRLKNALKNSDGLLAGLARGGLLEAKQAREDEVLAWVDADRARARRWRASLDAQDELIAREQDDALKELVLTWAGRSADLLGVTTQAVRWAQNRPKPDIQREIGYQDRDLERTRQRFEAMERTLHLPSDRDVFEAILTRYRALPDGGRIAALDAFIDDQGGVSETIELLYADPSLAKTEARLALLDLELEDLRASDDPWVQLALAIEIWAGPRREARKADAGAHQRLDPVWFDALNLWTREQGRVLYQDANSTLRLTLGHVEGYSPEDGLFALPQTTVAGLLAKRGPVPFDLPERVVAHAEGSRQSRFVDPALGDVPVNFLTTLDITGGNSGSAVLDGQGRLVGLAFDGNWESIASDWVFLPGLTRAICVDVRYLGWVLDGTPGSDALLKELGLHEDPS
ncbi:MAG: S46 family peptidase [Deltaproteobacteria bacterium]|nr:MAG: S46 family peptidase [Deltaproteobacteria bacterium]